MPGARTGTRHHRCGRGGRRLPRERAGNPGSPVVLWVAGRPGALTPPGVAVVGSRAASAGGTEVAERLGYDLAAGGVPVVSGLARGCDAAAHRGALAAGGVTIAVLGCGPDIVYPAEHRALYRRVRDTGAIVSEL